MVQGCVVEDLAELMMTEEAQLCRLQDHLRHGKAQVSCLSEGGPGSLQLI